MHRTSVTYAGGAAAAPLPASYREALDALQKIGISQNSAGQLIDTKVLGRPGLFHGRQAEWRDWSYVFSAFCGAISGELLERMAFYAKAESCTMMTEMEENDRRLARQLGFMITLIAKDTVGRGT